MIAQVGDNTDADGHYSIHLQPGEYTIMLSDFSGAYPQLPREGVYFVGSAIVAATPRSTTNSITRSST
jgi:hypothetical protein